ncbi:hypothetical protein P154DRAFT_452441 [Amniculicola lignicola CBS 123094]|uniref:Uncharacterized protein n=1 Tax=Amniculicola lignicola CBS 123094 TaxID=1392246 RepID=A0A6A5VUW2_9PLEO|nr:hypothetical protein P154DRAFT_452441 [Amniculicola lignicola CBS 123094]
MRQLYITKVRPVTSYRCGAWFINGLKPGGGLIRWSISKGLLKQLARLQNSCLTQIAGARTRTSSQILQKEPHIEPIDVFLPLLAI